MRYIKKFEMNEGKPKSGDYVICDGKFTFDLDFGEFIDANVGRITFPGFNTYYTVEYLYQNNLREYTINLENIKHWSSSKNELELVLNTNKFNI